MHMTLLKREKVCVFLNLSIVSFPKLVNMTKNTPFFPILHVFAPLNDVRAYIALSWKTTLIMWIFLRGWYPTSDTSETPPAHQLIAESKQKTRCHWDFTDRNAQTNSFTWVTPCPWIVKRCERDYHVTIPSFTNNFCWNLWRSDWVV